MITYATPWGDLNIVTRAEWGAAKPTKTPVHISTPTKYLWLHHTAGEETGPAGVKAIQKYHQLVKGWNDIAYSFMADDDGSVYEGRGAGISGGHTKNYNTVSHAICAMGNYSNHSAGEPLKLAIVKMTWAGMAQGWWPNISGGHRDAAAMDNDPTTATSCPGDFLYADIPELVQIVNQGADMPLTQQDIDAIAGRVREVLLGHLEGYYDDPPYSNAERLGLLTPAQSDRLKTAATSKFKGNAHLVGDVEVT